MAGRILFRCGSTDLLQTLDTAVNKPFKVYLRDFMDACIGDKGDRGEDVDSRSVSDERVVPTHVIAEAWEASCRDTEEYVHQHYY